MSRQNKKTIALDPIVIMQRRNDVCQPHPLRALRMRFGMNQTEFAVEVLKFAAISGQRTVSMWERGLGIPSKHIKTIKAFAKARGLGWNAQTGIIDIDAEEKRLAQLRAEMEVQ